MSRDELSYRVNIRIDRTEYPDVMAELEKLPASKQPSHLRLMLRLGAGLLNGSLSSTASPQERNVVTASVVPISQGNPSKSKSTHRVDPFDSRGLDPADFQFGQSK